MSRLIGHLVPSVVLLAGCEAVEPSAMEGTEQWKLSETPVFSKRGVVAGSDSLFFFRVLAGAFASNGEVVISLGAGNFRLIHLGPDGSPKGILGRSGAGPGELQSPTRLFEASDGIYIWDQGRARVLRYFDGLLADEHSFLIPPGHQVLGVMADQSIVTTLMPNPLGPLGQQFAPHLAAEGDLKRYYFWSPTGEELGSVSEGFQLPAPSFVLTIVHEGRELPIAFADSRCLPQYHASVRSDALLIANPRDGVVRKLYRDGRSDEYYRDAGSRTVSHTMYDSLSATLEAMAAGSRGRVTEESKRSALARLGEVGDRLPSTWSSLVAGPDGRLWLERASCQGSGGQAVTWDIIDANREHLASISLPVSFRLLAVSDTAILVVATDSLGVEVVAVHRIAKS